MRSKTLGIVAISLLAIFLLGTLVTAQNVITSDWWPTYHYDNFRDGLSPNGHESGAAIGLVWMFPRTNVVPGVVQDGLVDIPAPTSITNDWTISGTWFAPSDITDGLGAATDYYGGSVGGDGYRWAPIISQTQAGSGTAASVARWNLPSTFNKGNSGSFQVQVYFPSSAGGKRNSTAARYYVHTSQGTFGPYKVDQRSGGNWIALTAQPFQLQPGDFITMDNILDDSVYDQLVADDKANGTNITGNSIVCADAIRVVADTGIQIFSSPAGGVLNTADNFGNPNTGVVWIGDTEDPSASLAPSVAQNGAFYCIRSDYSTTTSSVGSLVTGGAQQLGTAVWRYPRGGRYDSANPITRGPLEGPIAGGVFSSPTMIEIGKSDGTTELAMVIGGMDRQVYCVDATDGHLIWKGPGVTISEPSNVADANGQSLPAGWTVENGGGTGRYDAFGGTFASVPASNDPDPTKRPTSIFYYIDKKNATSADTTKSDPRGDSGKTTSGHMYAIYAWIPSRLGTDPRRVRDAYYGITYGPSGAKTTDWVRVDQRDSGDPDAANVALPGTPGSGSWVRVGGSYWNPSLVELTSATQMDSTSLTDDNGKARVVAADAIMAVPDGIGAFTYSSPVWDKNTTTGRVYIGNSNGRVYSFMIQPDANYLANKATQLTWTFPKVQTANPATSPIDAQATPFGSIVSTPAFAGPATDGKVIVSSIDGKVYAIGNLLSLDETQIGTIWDYDSTEQVDSSGKITGHSTDSESFNSSPAVYGKRVYIPSSGGRLHALEVDLQPGGGTGTQVSQRAWVYPDNQFIPNTPGSTAVPLAPFRFSTPAIVKIPGDDISTPRIYVGNTGGQVYGFTDEGTRGRLLHDATDSAGTFSFEFKNPDLQGPIMSSVAIDGGDSGNPEGYGNYYGNIFAGTMGTGDLAEDGGFFWMNRRTGFASDNGQTLWQYSGYTNLGSVFSSPAIANHYTYVGIGKGRLTAFSATAFGGLYMGGTSVGEDSGVGDRVKPEDPTSNDNPQVDLFTAPVYKATKDLFDKAATANQLVGPGMQFLDALITAYSGNANFFVPASETTGAHANKPWYWHRRAFNYPGSGMTDPRQLYFEWGEDIYAIAWNLPPLHQIPAANGKPAIAPLAGGGYMGMGVGSDQQKGAVSFRFIDNSPGYSGGGTLPPKHPEALYEYNFRDTDGNTIERTVAIVKVEMRADSSSAPPPGVDWKVSIACAVQATGTTERTGLMPVSVPLLKFTPGSWEIADWKSAWDNGGAVNLSDVNIRHQPTGVNCPLGFSDEGMKPGFTTPGVRIGLGWPGTKIAGGYKGNRNDDPTAHFNGNGWVDSSTATPTWNTILPILYLGLTQHGTNSTSARAWMIDRSATGLRVTSAPNLSSDPANPDYEYHRDDSIKTLRMQSGDLHWNGGNGAVFNMLPWDYPPYFKPSGLGAGVSWQTRLQRDYPDISRRESVFQKSPDNNDPTVEKATLSPVLPIVGNASSNPDLLYDTDAVLRPDYAESWVEVPQFQPANISQPGYSTTVLVWLDTNGNGRLDGGQSSEDEPNTRSEPYRKFELSLDVPPDYHLAVEKPLTMDIVGQDRSMAPSGLGIGVAPSVLATGEWYKSFTVRNLGNVNLYNMNVAKRVQTNFGTSPLKIFADNVNPAYPIAGFMNVTPDPTQPAQWLQTGLVSSFDGWDPKYGDISGEPFRSTTNLVDGTALTTPVGYTLSKASVGDASGTVLTIPDQKKIDYWSGAAQINAFKTTIGSPFEPSISVRVPLGQPTGSYHAQIPIYADLNNDNYLQVINPGTAGAYAEPRSDPGINLNISVAEDRITGGPTPGSAVQVDAGTSEANGDVQPAVWRDESNGHINLVWSTNRSKTPTDPVTPNNPWYLLHARLPFDNSKLYTDSGGVPWQDNWQFGIPPASGTNPSNPQWWIMPMPGDPDWAFPHLNNGSGIYWPYWDTPIPAGAIAGSLKYSAPFVANVEGGNNSWLFFQGQLDAKDAVTNKILRESRLLYTSVKGGAFPDLTNANNAKALLHSPAGDRYSPKLAPKAAIYATGSGNSQTEHTLLTYHGGDAGRWSMFATYNNSPADAHDDTKWSSDVRLSVPACLVSTAEPMPVHRSIAGLGDNVYDIAYTGAWKYDQSTDIILTRYQEVSTSGNDIKMNVVKMPRVMNEEMLRDPKRNVYTSEHLSWLRPPTDGTLDDWGNKNTDYPYIRVLIPPVAPAVAWTAINAMESTAGGNPTVVKPSYDRAAGIYSYQYPAGTPQDDNLGQMLLDTSSGIVRFTRPLPPKTKVIVEYTPQAQRLTRGLEQDSAPFMFIEKNPMPTTSPGVVPWVDGNNGNRYDQIGRRWLFWRKPATSGVLSSSIYYKTYRVGTDLVDTNGNPLVDAKGNSVIRFNQNGTPAYDITITDSADNQVKCTVEISWDGKRIFFPANYERYPGMPNNPGPLTVHFAHSGQNDTDAPNAVLDTLTWQEELPETALPTRQKVNEGQVSAFVDPLVNPTKVWVFWSSTRAGKSDLYYQTISPMFRPLN